MKLLLTTLFVLFSLTIFSQSNGFSGDYSRTFSTAGDDLIQYKLNLLQDGTFVFHSYSKIKNGFPSEVNKYGKGKWTATANVVTFFSNKQKDFDEKYTLDFNNTKTRFMSKHPRDKTDRIIKTRIHFLESDIFWIKGLDIFKI